MPTVTTEMVLVSAPPKPREQTASARSLRLLAEAFSVELRRALRDGPK
jgi:hypothetical protein